MNGKISINIGDFQEQYGELRALEIAKKVGAQAVDFCTTGGMYDYRNPQSVYSKTDCEIISHYEEIKAYADSLGLEIGQTHGRIEGRQHDEAENEASIKNARIDCLVAKVLGAPYVVMHSVNTSRMGPDTPPEVMHDVNFDMFNTYLQFAKEYDVKIATETFGDAPRYGCCDFFGNIDEFIKSYNRICNVGSNGDYFTVCVDTGHSNKASRFGNNPSPAEIIQRLGENITCLHLNDNDKMTDQHKPLRTGCIDWEDVFAALGEIGYKGNYNMELNYSCFGKNLMKETAAFAVTVLKDILGR